MRNPFLSQMRSTMTAAQDMPESIDRARYTFHESTSRLNFTLTVIAVVLVSILAVLVVK